MKLDFGRPICGNLTNVASREWLVTNGIGGFASGTIAGLLTRRYHGLLIAALMPPLARKLLVTKFDEKAFYQDISYPLYTNRWADGTLEPQGFHYIGRFHLEGTTPVWTFTCADSQQRDSVYRQGTVWG
jgi:predicted glycogen debranching enzyme